MRSDLYRLFEALGLDASQQEAVLCAMARTSRIDILSRLLELRGPIGTLLCYEHDGQQRVFEVVAYNTTEHPEFPSLGGTLTARRHDGTSHTIERGAVAEEWVMHMAEAAELFFSTPQQVEFLIGNADLQAAETHFGLPPEDPIDLRGPQLDAPKDPAALRAADLKDQLNTALNIVESFSDGDYSDLRTTLNELIDVDAQANSEEAKEAFLERVKIGRVNDEVHLGLVEAIVVVLGELDTEKRVRPGSHELLRSALDAHQRAILADLRKMQQPLNADLSRVGKVTDTRIADGRMLVTVAGFDGISEVRVNSADWFPVLGEGEMPGVGTPCRVEGRSDGDGGTVYYAVPVDQSGGYAWVDKQFTMSGHAVTFRGPRTGPGGQRPDEGADVVVEGEDLGTAIIVRLAWDAEGKHLVPLAGSTDLPDFVIADYIRAAKTVWAALAKEQLAAAR